MPTQLEQFADALKLNASKFGVELCNDDIRKLTDYYDLILKWNARLHLVAPCSSEEFATRHTLESLLLLKHLPSNARIADIGSGGGLPIIPCLLVREDLHATLFESSQKKAVFLREAARQVKPPDRIQTVSQRFEKTKTPQVDFITCRALDRFNDMLPTLIDWAPREATFLLFSGESMRKQIELLLAWVIVEHIPRSKSRFLVLGRHLTS